MVYFRQIFPIRVIYSVIRIFVNPMDKYFYDKKNFDNINQVIDGAIFKKTGQRIDNKHSKLVYKLMDYVYKTTSRPEGLKKKQFLTLLNHQVIKVALPRIEKLTQTQMGAAQMGASQPQAEAEMLPPPAMNSRQDFNFDNRLAQAQMERGVQPTMPPQASLQGQGQVVQEQRLGQGQKDMGTISDVAMNEDESQLMYEKLLASRQQGIQMASTVQAGNNLTQRNESMSNFEDKQREINNGVETYSERVEEMGEGEKAGADTFDEQFKPILGGNGGNGGNGMSVHPASSQASDFNALIGQNVETLLAKRLTDNGTIIADNGGIEKSGFKGDVTNMFEKVSVGQGSGSGVEPVIEKMTGTSVIEDVGNVSDKVELRHEEAMKNRMVVPPVPQDKYIKRQYYINIDSRDRDLEVYPDVNKFQVKFSPSSDSNEIFQYRDASGEILYQTSKNFVGDGHGAALPEIYDNIFSIECVSAIVPYDISYVCGICPYQFNGATIDQNKVADANQFTSWPFGPINTAPGFSSQKLGIATSVLDEPYLLLNVDELEGNNPYIGTNKATTNTFAKLLHDGYYGVLTSFIQLKTDHGERKIFKPQALGKLDKMTLNLMKHNGIRYNFGVDKIFVKRFKKYTDENGCEKTLVYIIPPKDECGECNISHGHCLRPGNLIYFYDTVDCVNNEIKFYDHVHPTVAPVESATATVTEVSGTEQMKITAVAGTEAKPVNFAAFINIGDYVSVTNDINQKYTLRVENFASNGFAICVHTPDDFGSPSATINNFGFFRKNMKGINSEIKGKFNYIDGQRVCQTARDDDANLDGNDPNTVFYINMPFNQLPERLQDKDLVFGEGGEQSEVFFIKKKMQVSYTFRVTVLEKDINQVHSSMI